MNKFSFISFVNTLVVIIIFGVVVGGVWYVATHQSGYLRQEVRAAFVTQYQGVTKQYKRRMGDYTGMCQELAAPDTVFCQSMEDEYRLFKLMPEGGYLCIDSTGFSDIIETPPKNSYLCVAK